MSRGPRMEPMLYDTLHQKIRSLSTDATCIRLGAEITPQGMKKYLQAIARDLNILITVRRAPGGVIFRRSTDEDIQQTQETASRLQTARQPQPQACPRGHRPRGIR